MPANNEQVGGTHYKDMAVQPWDAMRAWMSPEAFRGFLLGNVIKYAARHQAKGGLEDLRKASHYLDKLMEVVEAGRAEGAKVLYEALDTMDRVLDTAVSKSAAGGPTVENWIEAPAWANHWYLDANGDGVWHESPAVLDTRHASGWTAQNRRAKYDRAPDFDFPSNLWRCSRRDRPRPFGLPPDLEAVAQAKFDALHLAGWPGPDWSQAPDGANWWCVSPGGNKAKWHRTEPHLMSIDGRQGWEFFCLGSNNVDAPLFNYTGDWRDSLRKRPEVGS